MKILSLRIIFRIPMTSNSKRRDLVCSTGYRNVPIKPASRSSGYPFPFPMRLLGQAPSPGPTACAFSRTCLTARLFRSRWSLVPAHPRGKNEARFPRQPRRSRRVFSFGGGDKHLYLFNLPFGYGGDRFLFHRRPIPVDKTLCTEPRGVCR